MNRDLHAKRAPHAKLKGRIILNKGATHMRKRRSQSADTKKLSINEEAAKQVKMTTVEKENQQTGGSQKFRRKNPR